MRVWAEDGNMMVEAAGALYRFTPDQVNQIQAFLMSQQWAKKHPAVTAAARLDKAEAEENDRLTVVRTYPGWALYSGDELVMYNRDGRDWPVSALKALGYRVTLVEMTQQDFWSVHEYLPPKSLAKLREEWLYYLNVVRETELERAKARVARLGREAGAARVEEREL